MIAVARSRGFLPIGRDNTIARLVVQSPKAGSRGRSSVASTGSGAPSSVAARTSSARRISAAVIRSFAGPVLEGPVAGGVFPPSWTMKKFGGRRRGRFGLGARTSAVTARPTLARLIALATIFAAIVAAVLRGVFSARGRPAGRRHRLALLTVLAVVGYVKSRAFEHEPGATRYEPLGIVRIPGRSLWAWRR